MARKKDNTMNGIHGMLMRPLALKDNHDKIAQSSQHSVRSGFLRAYQDHIAGMQIVAMCAKVYIRDNWEKISDWTGLDVVVEDSKRSVEYFNYTGPRRLRRRIAAKDENPEDVIARMHEEIDIKDKKRHNPITKVEDVVLDEEWDFSMKINGNDHWWLSDDSVVVIAAFIEKKLDEQAKADSVGQG